MISALTSDHIAGSAFDAIADSYDSLFTTSVIGRSQRAVILDKAASIFRPGERILELNCGTGEDALFLAGRGLYVTACDASPRMIERARSRKMSEAPLATAEFHILCSEHLDQLRWPLRFDGVFSNFSGLNCIQDLSPVARLLSLRVKVGAQALLCLSTRFCLWETFHYIFRAEFRKAFRRWSGSTVATVNQRDLPVYYPTLRSVLNSFAPWFRLRSVNGVGLFVPPSYLESWARNNRSAFRVCELADRVVRHWPGIRVFGDHMLLQLERT
jgi:SAM-dependent methyltransferase